MTAVKLRLRGCLVDDEPLALKRLERLLKETGRVEVLATSTDPVEALVWLETHDIDVLFLDIQMPGMNGFEMLAKLDPQPLVVFTTAYDEYALRAFEVNSIDYLLKPVEAEQLERALNKLERIRRGAEARPELHHLAEQLAGALRQATPEYPQRVASRTGERVQFIDLSRVTHFFAKDKLTFAAAAKKSYPVDATIAELEQRLDPKKFVRIHRSTLLNIDYVHELHSWFAGRMLVRLKDENRTELTVARDRVRELKLRLGL